MATMKPGIAKIGEKVTTAKNFMTMATVNSVTQPSVFASCPSTTLRSECGNN